MSSTNNSKANTKPKCFKAKVRQYAALFDGSEKDFSSAAESAFNALYHNDFLGTEGNGEEEINKEAKRQFDKERLAAGAKVTNVTFTRTDWNKSLVTFHIENQGETAISKYLVTIQDKKI